jgi:hypothetical protein
MLVSGIYSFLEVLKDLMLWKFGKFSLRCDTPVGEEIDLFSC